MTTLLVAHDVTDLTAWKGAFDAGAAIRIRHGATASRALIDGNHVVGLIEFPDDASAQGFLDDPALRQPIPGVPAPPTVRLMHELDHAG